MSADIGAAADTLIRLELETDIGDGDRTGEWTIPADEVGEARIISREYGVACGVSIATRTFETVDPELEVVAHVGDGTRMASGVVVIGVGGGLRSILSAERTALNFLARLSGVATLTARYVEAVGTGRPPPASSLPRRHRPPTTRQPAW